MNQPINLDFPVTKHRVQSTTFSDGKTIHHNNGMDTVQVQTYLSQLRSGSHNKTRSARKVWNVLVGNKMRVA